MFEEYLPALFDVSMLEVEVVQKMVWPIPQLGQDLVQTPSGLQEGEVAETSCEPDHLEGMKQPWSLQRLLWQMQLAMKILVEQLAVLACVSEGVLLQLLQVDRPLAVGDAHILVLVAGMQMAAKVLAACGEELEVEEAELDVEGTLDFPPCSIPILAEAAPANVFGVLLAT